MEPSGAAPRVFISYSHDDANWKDRVVKQLGVLQLEGLLSVWDDHQINAGDDWLPAIEGAIESCSVALLLIFANFLTSNFIRSKEVPALLQRRKQEGVRVIPVILMPCPWNRVGWLGSIQARPNYDKPLSGMSEHAAETALAALAEEIADLLATKPDSLQIIPPTAPPADISTPPVGADEAQDVSETITEPEDDPLQDVVPVDPANSLKASCEVASAGGAQETAERKEISAEPQEISAEPQEISAEPKAPLMPIERCDYGISSTEERVENWWNIRGWSLRWRSCLTVSGHSRATPTGRCGCGI